MKQTLLILTFLLFTSANSVNATESVEVRDFNEAMVMAEFCGSACFKSNDGDLVELSEMNCLERENVLMNSIDILEMNEQNMALKGQELEELIPRVKNRISIILTSLDLDCSAI
ncbi:hypothetical protein A9Q84_04930 [Halobacteriovorax marinus]|uniref:Secreted protein n=1 Tax=Halobacteriovorax marinus TaxID=97084 RepID=A0A1Y5FAR0_9BACT|nr:hypothetical protein A9Q84_04930 [Halobacteriovorax marinus]